ncbi:uncharacterized protein LOC105699422 isoform X2 [Orussus abietinus]|uniref:uncharacterized protein LOC105699422 isoform X2 n=1 Tax=Orussus abietinus TaxID=222816 RepID=UPI000625296C|nr:uncharacterized protein LOC105699422 isoform X2 [Orussus abietinus]XP_012279811.1 uncharacterized protein LOC105699422 isoform X2 [Orussus abietinus]
MNRIVVKLALLEERFDKWSFKTTLICATILGMKLLICEAPHWMYSKSWIENYRLTIQLGLPWQPFPAEYTMKTHKIGIVERSPEFSEKMLYNYKKSFAHLSNYEKTVIDGEGYEYSGKAMSDMITILKHNMPNVLPSVRIDFVLLDKIPNNGTSFIGLLNNPKTDRYISFYSALKNYKQDPVAFKFVLCGNYERKDMLSKGYMEVLLGEDPKLKESNNTFKALVNDPYFYDIILESILLDGKAITKSCRELNIKGVRLENTVPGIYLPIRIYSNVIDILHEFAERHNLLPELRIWETDREKCFENPINWDIVPNMTLTLFSAERNVFSISYSGNSLIQRYYTTTNYNTFCYIFAICNHSDERIILGRAAFEGLKVVLNRSGNSVSLSEQNSCGPKVRLNNLSGSVKMSLCLTDEGVTNNSWIWLLTGIAGVGLLSYIRGWPKSPNQQWSKQPIVRIFLPQSRNKEKQKQEGNVKENNMRLQDQTKKQIICYKET